jgi:hypothetical protein
MVVWHNIYLCTSKENNSSLVRFANATTGNALLQLRSFPADIDCSPMLRFIWYRKIPMSIRQKCLVWYWCFNRTLKVLSTRLHFSVNTRPLFEDKELHASFVTFIHAEQKPSWHVSLQVYEDHAEFLLSQIPRHPHANSSTLTLLTT